MKIGNKDIVNLYVGSTQVQKIYMGTVLVWSRTTNPTFNQDGSMEMGSGGGYMDNIDDAL